MVGQEIGGAGVGSSCHGARVGKVLLGPSTLAFCRALLYLQELAEELTSVYQPPPCHERVEVPPGSEGGPARKRRGRKPQEHNGENEEDADFVLQEEEEEEESDLMLSETSESELDHLPQGAAVTLPFGIIAGMRWALHGVWGRGGGAPQSTPFENPLPDPFQLSFSPEGQGSVPRVCVKWLAQLHHGPRVEVSRHHQQLVSKVVVALPKPKATPMWVASVVVFKETLEGAWQPGVTLSGSASGTRRCWPESFLGSRPVLTFLCLGDSWDCLCLFFFFFFLFFFKASQAYLVRKRRTKEQLCAAIVSYPGLQRCCVMYSRGSTQCRGI